MLWFLITWSEGFLVQFMFYLFRLFIQHIFVYQDLSGSHSPAAAVYLHHVLKRSSSGSCSYGRSRKPLELMVNPESTRTSSIPRVLCVLPPLTPASCRIEDRAEPRGSGMSVFSQWALSHMPQHVRLSLCETTRCQSECMHGSVCVCRSIFSLGLEMSVKNMVKNFN